MSETRIIKKYPNRRLYDTAISSYITLEDVRRLVIEQVPITVIDARTQEDITHPTLLQIIVEQEEKGPSLFSIDSLQNMIRTYGNNMHTFINQMFEHSMAVFSQQENVIKGSNEEWIHKDPARMMSDITQQNLAHWQKWQQHWLTAFSAKKSESNDSSGFNEQTDENDSLKQA